MAVDTKEFPRTDDAVHDMTARVASTHPVEVSKRLVHMVERSAQSLRHAAENVESRGLKLLLKVLAQERAQMHNALRQASGYRGVDPLDPNELSPATSLQEGLQDIQSSMTVKQQGREHVALSNLLDEEEELVEAYTNALNDEPDATARELLAAQRDHVARFVARLRAVDYTIEPIVARVFDTQIEGEAAAARLRERGFSSEQIDIAPINQLVGAHAGRDPAAVSAARSPRQTVVAGAFAGALCGGIVGLALAAFVWMAPQLVGWITVGPWQLLLGALLAGAVGGAVFGFFIGQNQKEIDQAVTADSLINGEILIATYPEPSQVAMAEEVLQVHHARELNR